MTWLSGQGQVAGGRTVAYTRGATSVTITAVLGRTLFASNEEGGPRVEFGDRDYLVNVAALAALGFGEPRVGDRVTDAGLTFEVQTPDVGEPAWRYSDPGRTDYRLHTKQVG